MSTYLVQSASIYRNSGILRVETEEFDPQPGRILEVVGAPDKYVTFRTARPVFDDAGNVAARRIIVIEPPSFPIEELVGQRLSSKSERSISDSQ